MIEVRNISYAYGKNVVLQNVDLHFAPGKLYAIIGPNGSGKTTLIKLLSKQAKPKSGQLFLNGRPYGDFPRKEFAKQVALLPQGRNTPNTTVLDLVSCGRYPYLELSRRLTARDQQIVQAALAATDTAGFAHRNVKTLSGGERQRAYMAMLYAQDTPYVLLDEPATHLDIASGFEIMELLVQMKNQGKCVIAVLHDLSMALKYADRLVLMDKTGAVLCACHEELLKSGRMEPTFQVKCTPIEWNGKTEYLFSKE